MDTGKRDFDRALAALQPAVVIHTAGPFQGQDYRVAEACIRCDSHYADLADGREFVDGFSSLNDQAIERDLLLVTGASTLPGLSSVVLDALKNHLGAVEAIEISIAPAQQTPRGLGTVSAVLSYCGRPFDVLMSGDWRRKHGWQDLKFFRYPNLGRRLGAACDVPDLSLFASSETNVKTVTFHAALEATWEHVALWLMAWAVRIRLINNWSRYASLFRNISQRLAVLGSDRGGMHMTLQGVDRDGRSTSITWNLTANNNHGPEIPCSPALIIARQLASGQLSQRGAVPCVGLFTLADFDKEMSGFDISWQIQESA